VTARLVERIIELVNDTLTRGPDIRRVPPSDLGPTLRRARVRAGLGLRDTARRIGISHGYLFALEAGERCPSLTIAAVLTEILGLSADESVILSGAAVSDAGRDHPWRTAA
jgi:transcriptional regulator with XRE-family HTH domain